MTLPDPIKVSLPYKFEPRKYQRPFLQALDRGYKRGVAVWHRRAGKDKTFLNFMIKKMYQRIGSYYYFFPTYSQGKKVLWNGLDRDGFKFMHHFPNGLVVRRNDTELLVEMKNKSIFQIIGTDNYDAIMGTNPVGCVFSEFPLQDPRAWDYVRPILAENGGWAVFCFTPRGKNHAYYLLEMAKKDPLWVAQVLTVKDTQAIPEDILAQELKEIVAKDGNDSLYQQEYFCSFDVPIVGSYYAEQLIQAEKDGRIGSIPYDQAVLVDTAWDLGIDDSMTIWFYQTVGKEIRFIDYFETTGEGLPYCIKILREKPYTYGDHYAPHDIAVRELGTGKSRWEVAHGLGVTFKVAQRLPVEDGISAVRSIFSQCWFNETSCEKGLSALRSYRKEWDEKNETFKKRPHHDWASHGADAFRTFAVTYRKKIKPTGATGKTPTFDPYGRR